jgi:cell division protein ZipA
MAALNTLLDSAKKIAIELDGDLKDDSRSAFTKQTEDHYRQRIIDFNRIQIPGI